MKKLLTLLILSSFLFSCKDDDENILDIHTPLAINGQVQTKSTDAEVLHVVKNASTMINNDDTERSLGYGENYLYENGITRDIENRRLLFAGGHVIKPNVEGPRLGLFITDTRDVIFTSYLDAEGNTIDPSTVSIDNIIGLQKGRDTIAYIPNKILKAAQEAIIIAFEAEDYETCYALFDSAIVFVPITGAEYRKLKADGVE